MAQSETCETARRLSALRAPGPEAALDAMARQLEDWRKSQHYSYIDRNGKRTLARDLEQI